jgi:hypothetical protein
MQSPKMSKVEVASHFELTRTTVRDILAKAYKYESGGSEKHEKKGKFCDLENALVQWFTQRRAAGIVITDQLLKEKASQLGKLMSKLHYCINAYVLYMTCLVFVYMQMFQIPSCTVMVGCIDSKLVIELQNM